MRPAVAAAGGGTCHSSWALGDEPFRRSDLSAFSFRFPNTPHPPPPTFARYLPLRVQSQRPALLFFLSHSSWSAFQHWRLGRKGALRNMTYDMLLGHNSRSEQYVRSTTEMSQNRPDAPQYCRPEKARRTRREEHYIQSCGNSHPPFAPRSCRVI
jgi:hypothetical protein